MGLSILAPRSVAGRRAMLAAAAVLAGCAAVAASQVGVSAESTTLMPDRQLYATKGPDPYMDQELHLAIAGGQPQAWSYLHFDLRSLPGGAASIDQLTLSLVPDASAEQNQNPAGAGQLFGACPLTQPLPAQVDDTNPPPYDCSQVHIAAQPGDNGSWTVGLDALLPGWRQSGNTGLALVPMASFADLPPNPAGASPEDTWTAAFDHTKTAAAVAFTPPDFTPQLLAVPGPAQPLPANLPAVVSVPPPVHAAQAPTPPPPPSPAPAAAAAAPVAPAVPVVTSAPRLAHGWLVVLGIVAGAAALLLAMAALQQLNRTGALSLATLGRSLVSARSQMATPLALLGLVAVVSAGYAGEMVTSVHMSAPGATASTQGTAGGGSGAGAGGGGAGAGAAGAAASQAAAAAQAQAAAAAASAAAAAAPGHQGVTATTVTVGMSYATDTNTNNQAFGVSGDVNNFGDGVKQAQVMVDWVNRHGGIAGHRVLIDWQAISISRSESDPNYLEEVCKNYTEGDHVFAVVDWINSIDNEACYAQEHTLLFDMSPDQGDQSYYRQLAPYLWAPASMATDRAMKTKIDGLARLNYFSGGSLAMPYKLGILVPDEGDENEILQGVTLPELAKYGIKGSAVEPFKVRDSSIQALAQDLQTAVVKFNADGVNHVITQGSAAGGEGGMMLIFAIGAYKQQYHPLYGLGSNDAPGALEQQNQQVMSDQLKNAVAVGWDEGNDVEDANGDPWPPSGGPEKRCMDIMTAGGVAKAQTRTDSYTMQALCDTLTEMWQPMQGTTTLTAQVMSARIAQLGGAYQSGNAYSSYTGINHWDTPNGYRLLHEDPSCTINGSAQICFKFDSFTTYDAAAIEPGEP